MESEVYLCTTYKKVLLSYHTLLLEQSYAQRVWFGTAVPISYIFIPVKDASVHVQTCSTPRQTSTLSFVNSSLVRSRSFPANLTVVSRKSYT